MGCCGSARFIVPSRRQLEKISITVTGKKPRALGFLVKRHTRRLDWKDDFVADGSWLIENRFLVELLVGFLGRSS